MLLVSAPEWSPSVGFDPCKAVQVVGFFARKEGGEIDKLKVIKLVYLADRLSFKQRSQPINFDDFYSLPHGPVPSSTLDGINGKINDPAWKAVHLKGGKRVTVDEAVGEDHLSRADRRILEEIWAYFGRMSAIELRNWTHENCREYEEVSAGRLPIGFDEILEAVGVEAGAASEIARDLRYLQREIGRIPTSDAA